jgi:23S rRNA (guanosine2251-2'-O)-methyltransferase
MKHKKEGKIYMYGKHALVEALQGAPQIVKKAYLAHGTDSELRRMLEKAKVSVSDLEPKRGDELVGRDAAHQGVIAVVDPTRLLQPFNEFLLTLPSGSPNTALAVLGEVQDPHNVGAIIRSAAAFGFAGVLIPEHNQAGVTGAVIKASAGMVFKIPLVSIGNVNQALKVLKDKGFWIYGLAANGTHPLATEKFDAPAVFVVGNEGSGIREKTLEACDIVLNIPMHPRTESLNAAVSAAVVFYDWSKQHPSSPATGSSGSSTL